MDNGGIKTAKRATLVSVAKLAGVSKSTVSRILDERLPQSDSDTAHRVREVATRLGYIRDNSATSLRRGRTMTVGVVVPRLSDTVMALLYEAISAACSKLGYFSIVATTGDQPAAERVATESLLKRGVDGLILATYRTGDALPDELRERGIPHVLALRTDGHSRSAVGDDRFGGYLATRHLLDLGHRHIGIIGGPTYASSAQGRVRGYREALEEAGVALNPAYVRETEFSIEAGAMEAPVLMGLSPKPTAIFAVNDNTALGTLSALAAMGLRVPEDVSVVGYNDIPIVRSLTTPLSTVHVPFDQVAVSALDLLLTRQEIGHSPIKLIRPTFIPRRSSARPRS
ncbi:LacI family DNA-binding transcriptional regulator [Acetobacter sacchari]|uniref:LacI family DNA-binding transcriptional regulator n=1 Tax=Acetobacter sacchari TaxID=2661687 RepID=A0ABS3LWE0_9PROT|nr:LacI family DNA-binding transcriptional regulator [Acetobacter sacchari]MBO1360229.1 LacI family DNA-binding transcriptional regulator [Acetobacter sacchari]